MALSDIYQLVQKQTYGTKNIENVWFYQKEAPESTAQDLSDAFQEDLLPVMLAMQGFVMRTVELYITNLGNLADFWTEALDEQGTFGDVDCLPAINAINYTMKPATRAVREGSKRICGIPEAVTDFDTVTNATYLTKMEALRIAIDTPLNTGGEIFTPCIVKRIKEEVTGTVPLQYTYRLPTVGDTLTVTNFAAVLVNKNITSQVSRKK